MWRTYLRSLADVVFPASCHLCRSPLDAGEDFLCVACRHTLAEECEGDGCPTCGAAAAPWEVFQQECAACRVRPTPLRGTIRVGPYRGTLGRLVRLLKYDAREELTPLLVRWLTECIESAPWRFDVEIVATVPTHWRTRLTRPQHAADVLGSAVAERLDLPIAPLLRRIRAGRRQAGLSYTARKNNVHGAFVLSKGVALDRTHVLIIDDVKTTGATLDECARVLKAGGAASVYAAVIAKVDWQHQAGRAITVA